MRWALVGLAALAASLCGAASAQDFEPGVPIQVVPSPDLAVDPFSFRDAEIPANAQLPPVQGVCLLVFDVAADGRVRWSSIVADCQDDDHVDAAKELVAQRRFEPPMIDGEPQPQIGISLELRFRAAG